MVDVVEVSADVGLVEMPHFLADQPGNQITRLNRFTCVTARTSLGLRLAHVVTSMSPRLDSRWSGSFPLPGRESHPLEAPGLSWRSEEFLEIQIDDPVVPLFQIRLRLGDGRVTAASWSEAMARCVKGRLPVRAEHAVCRLLNPPIHDIGNTKAALAATWLRNPHPANHARAIGSLQQMATQHRQQRVECSCTSSTLCPSGPGAPRFCATSSNAPIRFPSFATSSIVIAGRVSPGVFLDFGTAYRAEGAGRPVSVPGTAPCGLSAVSGNRSHWPACSLAVAAFPPRVVRAVGTAFRRPGGVGSEEARQTALASVRRSNCTYGFPVCSFHEDSDVPRCERRN
jgi:hypothetical protein